MSTIFELLMGVPGEMEFETPALRRRAKSPGEVRVPDVRVPTVTQAVPRAERARTPKETFDEFYRGVVPPELQTGLDRVAFPFSFTTAEVGRAGPFQMGSMVASSAPGIKLLSTALTPFLRGAGNLVARKLSELEDPRADITTQDIIDQFDAITTPE